MQNLLIVGAGGFAGSICRYLMAMWVQQAVGRPWLPIGTFAVNVVGCFLIGLLGGLVEYRQLLSPETRLLVLVGVLGGFTTFSTFGFETFSLGRDGQLAAALGNVIGHVVLGVGAVWLGHVIARVIWGASHGI